MNILYRKMIHIVICLSFGDFGTVFIQIKKKIYIYIYIYFFFFFSLIWMKTVPKSLKERQITMWIIFLYNIFIICVSRASDKISTVSQSALLMTVSVQMPVRRVHFNYWNASRGKKECFLRHMLNLYLNRSVCLKLNYDVTHKRMWN